MLFTCLNSSTRIAKAPAAPAGLFLQRRNTIWDTLLSSLRAKTQLLTSETTIQTSNKSDFIWMQINHEQHKQVFHSCFMFFSWKTAEISSPAEGEGSSVLKILPIHVQKKVQDSWVHPAQLICVSTHEHKSLCCLIVPGHFVFFPLIEQLNNCKHLCANTRFICFFLRYTGCTQNGLLINYEDTFSELKMLIQIQWMMQL